MNVFAAHAAELEQARRPSRPEPLTGPIRTRAQARQIYTEIVGELSACEDRDTLDVYLMTIGEELIQFENEIDFLWNGDGADFLGLHAEIKAATARTSDEFRGEYPG